MTSPSSYRPLLPPDFIGSARGHALMLWRKCERLRGTDANAKLCFFGKPGLGKSALARAVARRLAGHELAIETVNGQSLSVDLVRRWRDNACYRPIWGDRTVKIVDEFERSSEAAQCETLTFLDHLPPASDFIATTNLDLDRIQERLQTRLQVLKFLPVETKELAAWLRQWVPHQDALKIAQASKGNVRAALLDCETWLDRQDIPA